ncbi:hypothetical protein P152DRAFT_457545 [Eremomyces bilateralis CBS 781.70]|uniref:Uncharacterized protein n=1 Tax=Eremomyces bilateralis CBS 781.70 TaxID=1392243 RepID=A0A6G1G5L9_9PEZI|nr:uncharacterized protein P152DRAFT_457545 [Eremomyces bilateralis CBS 781.70]KAF1813180.1 hypothetical protein P152DRAFT_457545 [Eremomyces bilateralis CBS 781.70]
MNSRILRALERYGRDEPGVIRALERYGRVMTVEIYAHFQVYVKLFLSQHRVGE